MKNLFTFFIFLLAGSVFAQKDTVFTIDLGKEKSIEYDARLDKNFKISINNIVPSKNYQISYEYIKNENVDNLGKLLMENATGLDLMKLINPTSRGFLVETFKSALDTLTNESQVSVITEKVDEAIAAGVDSITKIELLEIKKICSEKI